MADQCQSDRLVPPSGAELKLILREVKMPCSGQGCHLNNCQY